MKNKIKLVLYSTLKSKLMVFYCHYISFLFHFINSLPINLTKAVIGYWNNGFYFLFHAKAGFSTFYIRLLFTPTASTGESFIYSFVCSRIYLFCYLISVDYMSLVWCQNTSVNTMRAHTAGQKTVNMPLSTKLRFYSKLMEIINNKLGCSLGI